MTEDQEQKPNPVRDKAFAFALRIVRLYKYLTNEKKEYGLSKYLLHDGTNIGAFVESAQKSPDRGNFRHEMSIALQHASKSQYWLKLLLEGEYLAPAEFDSMFKDSDELISLLTSIVKTSNRPYQS